MDDRRKDALAKNEALFRAVNEQVDSIDRQSATPPNELTSFLCECSLTECLERVALTPAEYESVRSSPVRFVLVLGHEIPEIEVVVETTDRYAVVEKVEGERSIAQATDPRADD
jgi:hypothetical protein